MIERREGEWQEVRHYEKTTRVLLAGMLSLAVPLWIETMRSWTEEERMEYGRRCADIVAEKGDVILYRGNRGESAKAFNALAEGVAACAFAPGGVTILGLHFEARGDEEALLKEPRTLSLGI